MNIQPKKFSIVIPTLNAAPLLATLLEKIKSQTIQPIEILIIDSSSSDKTISIAHKHKVTVCKILRESFNHALTRQQAIEQLIHTDYVVLLTQDAILASDSSIETLLKAFEDPKVSIAYGRQLPWDNADSIEQHSRHYNYSDKSYIYSYQDKTAFGIKTTFSSDSFCAYRHSTFVTLGGFDKTLVCSEDMYFAAKVLCSGYRVAYIAEATVFHSHNLSLRDEFKRYQAIGQFHRDESWIIESFGNANKEGLRFIKSELKYLFKTNPKLIPLALLKTLNKWVAFKIGKYLYR